MLGAGRTASDAGVVDQHVEASLVGPHLVGQTAHLGDRGKVGEIAARRVVAGRLTDLLDRVVDAFRAATVDEDSGAIGGEPGGNAASEPGAGDKDCDRHLSFNTASHRFCP